MGAYREHALQTTCAVFLARALPPDATWTSVDPATDQHMDIVAGARRKARGLRPSWPDMQVIWRGLFHAVELKIGDGKQTTGQMAMQAEIERAGGKYAICCSVEELEEALCGWGIPLRAHSMEAAEYDVRREARMAAPKKASKSRPSTPEQSALRAIARARANGTFV